MESALRHDISRAIRPHHRRHPLSPKTRGLRNAKARTRRQFGTIILVTVGVVTGIGDNTHHEAPLSMTGLDGPRLVWASVAITAGTTPYASRRSWIGDHRTGSRPTTINGFQPEPDSPLSGLAGNLSLSVGLFVRESLVVHQLDCDGVQDGRGDDREGGQSTLHWCY